jgi:hypothetical protein
MRSSWRALRSESIPRLRALGSGIPRGAHADAPCEPQANQQLSQDRKSSGPKIITALAVIIGKRALASKPAASRVLISQPQWQASYWRGFWRGCRWVSAMHGLAFGG